MTKASSPVDIRSLLPDLGEELPDGDNELIRRVGLGDFGAQTFLGMSPDTRRIVAHLAGRNRVNLTSAISENPCLTLRSSRTKQGQHDIEAFTRNHVLVTDCLISHHGYSIDDLTPYWVMVALSDSVMGQSISKEDATGLRAFETRAEVEGAASVIAFILVLRVSEDGNVSESHVSLESITLDSGRTVTKISLVSPRVHKYLVENPYEARSLAEFVMERGYVLDESNAEGLVSVYQESKASNTLRSGVL